MLSYLRCVWQALTATETVYDDYIGNIPVTWFDEF